MSILSKIYSKIYDANSVQTTFNEDSEGIGGEIENVISSTEEITDKGE